MKISTQPNWKAFFTLSLKKSHTSRHITEKELVDAIGLCQKIQKSGGVPAMELTIKMETFISFEGAIPVASLHFHNSIEQRLPIEQRKRSIQDLATRLMELLDQEKIMIVFPDKSVFLENKVVSKIA